MLATSGVGWDPINKVMECSNDTWLSYAAVIMILLHYLPVLKHWIHMFIVFDLISLVFAEA